jgi:hypothetical protein
MGKVNWVLFLDFFGYYYFYCEKDILYKKLVMWIRRVQSRGLSGGGGDKKVIVGNNGTGCGTKRLLMC